MFTWIAKVAPQPPQPVKHLEITPEVKSTSQPAEELQGEKTENFTENTEQASLPKNETDIPSNPGETQAEPDQVSVPSAETSAGGGVLVWIAQNISRLIPQHLGSPTLPKAAPAESEKEIETKEEEPSTVIPSLVPAPTPAPDPSPAPAPPPTPAPDLAPSPSPVLDPALVPESVPAPDDQPLNQATPIAENPSIQDQRDGGRSGGMFRWFVQGLEKVLPQPEGKSRPTNLSVVAAEVSTAPQEETAKAQTEQCTAETMPEPVVKPEPEPEPEPELKVEVAVVPETPKEATVQQAELPTDTGSIVSVFEMPQSSANGSSMFGWVTQSLGKVIPQPVGSSVPVTAKVKMEPAPQEYEVPVEEKEPQLNVTNVNEEVPKAVTIIEVVPADPTPELIVKDENQPAGEPVTKTSNEEAKSVFSWLAKGLGNVVPQPVIKSQLTKEDDRTITACHAEERGKPVLVSETNGK